jgi:hypothetical protein
MGLLNKLQTVGSAYTTYDGSTPPINPLATNQSNLHGNLAGAVNGGYSLNGGPTYQSVNTAYQSYDDGIVNPLPFPSLEDLNGVPPTIANHNNFSPNASTQALPYLNNQPI